MTINIKEMQKRIMESGELIGRGANRGIESSKLIRSGANRKLWICTTPY